MPLSKRVLIIIFFIAMIISILVTSTQTQNPIIEKVGGYVSRIEWENEKPILYLDVSPYYDNDGDELLRNDSDIWVSTSSNEVIEGLQSIQVGDYVLSTVEWMPKESAQYGMNRYYIQSIENVILAVNE